MKKFSFILLLLFSFNTSFSQTGSINGRVKDNENKPLTGANIILKGTTTGTASDIDGYFTINNVPFGSYTIEISMIGFQKKEKNILLNQEKLNTGIVILKPEAIKTDQIVITAGKYEQRITELPVSAALLTSDDITKKNYLTIEDALRYVPGVNFTLDQVSIRGSSGYSRGAGTRVLVAIDGVPFYSGDTGEIVWEVIPLTALERIEIIKGAASSLYGSTAIGGVINVITKKIDTEPSFYIKTSLGIYDKPVYKEWDWSGEYRIYNTATLAHSNRLGNFGYTVSYTRNENQSYRQSGFFTRHLGFIKAEYDFSPNTSLGILINGHQGVSGNFLYWKDSRNVLVPPDADQGQKTKSFRIMNALLLKHIVNSNLFFDLKGSYYRTKWEDETVSKNSSTTHLLRGELQTTYQIEEKLMLVSGGELSAGKVNSNIFTDPYSFGAGLYSQVDYEFSFPLRASIGLRYDYSKLDSLDGSRSLSPKVGLNYKLSESTILRSSFGTGFRAPSLAEAFTSTSASGIVIKPNPNLKSERNFSFEIGGIHNFNNYISVDAAFFQNEYYDFIEPKIDPVDGKAFFNNVTRARIQGTELNITTNPFPDLLTIAAGYTYLWARDIQQKKALKYRPRHILTVKADITFGDLEIGSDFRYWSKVEEIDYELIALNLIPDGELRSEVFVLDLRAGYNLLSTGIPGRIFFNANNILNYYYVEMVGNLSPIRNLSIGLEFFF